MRLPRNPPDIGSIPSEGLRSQEFLSEEVGRYAEGFNRRHLHWSEVRLRDHKGRYERSYVLGETDENDMTYFVLYNLRALSSVIDGVRGLMYVNGRPRIGETVMVEEHREEQPQDK